MSELPGPSWVRVDVMVQSPGTTVRLLLIWYELALIAFLTLFIPARFSFESLWSLCMVELLMTSNRSLISEQTAYKMKFRARRRLATQFHHPPLIVAWVSEGTQQRRPCRSDFIKACQIAPVGITAPPLYHSFLSLRYSTESKPFIPAARIKWRWRKINK